MSSVAFCFAASSILFVLSCSSPSSEQANDGPASDTVMQSTAPASPTVALPTTPTVTAATPPPPPAGVATTIVANLYAAHDAEKSPFFQSESRGRINRYFTDELTALIWRDAKSTQRGGLARLDVDPLYDTQDADIKEFIVQPATVRGNRAEVQVTFSNLGARKAFTYRLENERGNWRIADILYNDGSRLSQRLMGESEGE